MSKRIVYLKMVIIKSFILKHVPFIEVFISKNLFFIFSYVVSYGLTVYLQSLHVDFIHFNHYLNFNAFCKMKPQFIYSPTDG